MCRSFCFMCRIKIHLNGLEKVDPDKTYIYIANHQSIFDIIGIWVVFPYKFKWLAKKELLKIPVISWGLKKGGYIVFDRSNLEDARQSVSTVLTEIQKGNSIIIFPEGTRSEDGNIQNFKRGAFWMAYKTATPVVPVVIKGSNKIKPKKGIAVHSGTIDIQILAPINIPSEDSIQLTIKKIRSQMIQTLVGK